MRLRRLALVVLLVALAPQTVEAAVTRHPNPPPQGGRVITARAPRIVDVRTIAKRPPNPSLSRKGAGRLLPLFQRQPGGRYTSSSITGPKAVEAARIFEGLSLALNGQLYGTDQDVEPADAQIGASPSALVEVAGNTMALYGPDGSLQWTVDIQALFQLPAGYFFYAPSLQYDWGSGRWFLGGIASNTTAHNSWLLMAVSRSGNPFGTWSLIITDARINNPSQCQNPCPNTVYYMRESIAVVGDKVVQTEQAQNCLSACTNVQGAFLVMRKDNLVAGVQPAVDHFSLGYGQEDFLAVPPQSVGGTYGNIAFLVWLKRGTSVTMAPDRIGLLQVTGLPDPNRFNSFNGTTVVWEKDFGAAIPNSNFLVPQPGGTVYASPTPITSATYRDSRVVLAMNDACGPLNCVRVVKMSNFGGATPVATSNSNTFQNNTVTTLTPTDLDRSLGLSNAYLFDASLAIDPYGNLFVAAAFSSSTQNPGMAVAGISAPIDSTSTVTPTSRIVEGPSSYNCFSNSSNLWGAYMRSVPDPNNYARVWMPAEAAVHSCWATAIVSATTGVGPQAVRMSPTVGSTKGGQVVEIDGSFFVPDADQLLFGGTPGTIVAESSNTIIVNSPPGVAGTVTVTVQTPDGTSTAGTFTYVAPGQLVPPPTSTGLHWR